MKEFIRNLICYLFGHQITKENIDSLIDASPEERKTSLHYCPRCDSYRPFKRFIIIK